MLLLPNRQSSYVVPETIDSDGLSLAPAKHELLSTLTRKFVLLHFGYVTQCETFCRAVITVDSLYNCRL
jgi:hypothetical protein